MISNIFSSIFKPRKNGKTGNITFENHKDHYCKHMYMTKNDAEVIEIIAKTCHISRKDVHDARIQFGLR